MRFSELSPWTQLISIAPETPPLERLKTDHMTEQAFHLFDLREYNLCADEDAVPVEPFIPKILAPLTCTNLCMTPFAFFCFVQYRLFTLHFRILHAF